MSQLSPKSNFITFQKGAAEELKKIRELPVITVSSTYALAQMSYDGATAEQLKGARDFISVLQNLWDAGEKQTPLPVKRLETFDLTPEKLAELAASQNTEKPTEK